MSTLQGLGCAAMLAVVLVGLPGATPVSADCQGGTVWPSLERARGTTFIGVFEGTTEDESGYRTHEWTVERVFAGPLKPGPLRGWGVGQGCHHTAYREGERYLVSSQFPGGATAFDSVAYRVIGDGRVRLAAYPEQPARTAPRVYQIGTLREALDLLAPGRSPERPASRASRPPFEPSTRSAVKNDLFKLVIETQSGHVVEGEPIPITTRLRYIGTAKNKQATVAGSPGGLVAFRVKQIGGPVDNGPGWAPSCWFHELEPVENLHVPFEKSGGFDPSGPMADFWRDWFEDPELRLPEGRYEITAYAHHGARGAFCRGPWETLTASVAIEVVADSGASDPPRESKAITELASLVWPDAAIPASLAEYLPAARRQLWTETTDGMALPALHLQFIQARCNPQGGVALVFREVGLTRIEPTFAFAVRGSLPTKPDDSWSGGHGLSSVLDDSEFIHLMGSETYACP